MNKNLYTELQSYIKLYEPKTISTIIGTLLGDAGVYIQYGSINASFTYRYSQSNEDLGKRLLVDHVFSFIQPHFSTNSPAVRTVSYKPHKNIEKYPIVCDENNFVEFHKKLNQR